MPESYERIEMVGRRLDVCDQQLRQAVHDASLANHRELAEELEDGRVSLSRLADRLARGGES